MNEVYAVCVEYTVGKEVKKFRIPSTLDEVLALQSRIAENLAKAMSGSVSKWVRFQIAPRTPRPVSLMDNVDLWLNTDLLGDVRVSIEKPH